MRNKNRFFRKSIALFMLFLHTGQIFASGLILDPNSKHNTKLDESKTGVPIVNVATPSNRGISVNEFLEYNIDKKGQVLNNADNVGRSHLAGLINGNPNFKANQAANLILLKVNGSNRSQIEGYLEALSRKKVDVVLSNENGIYINNSGTINIKNFAATTGKIKLQDGDFVGVDVEKGLIAIGPKGMDLTNTNYVEILSKTLEVAGKVVTNGDLKIVAGSNKIKKDGTIEKINTKTKNQVAIDATNLGGMYANTIRIISTDKGAGVNSDSFIISKNNKLEITADGKIKVNKVQGKGIDIKGTSYEQKESAISDEEIVVNAKNIKLSGTGTEANRKIELNGDVVNSASIFTKENLKTKSLINSGDIQVNNKIKIDGNLNNSGSIKTAKTLEAKDTKNTKEILVAESINVENLENTGNLSTDSTLKVDGKLSNSGNIKAVDKIDVKENILNKGEILTNNTLTSKDVFTTKKLIAKNVIYIGSLENSGVVGTDKELNVKGKLENSGEVKALGNILVAEDTTNTGDIETNGTFTSKNLETIKKLIALKDISVNNLKSDGTLLTNQKLTVKGNLENKGKIQVVDNIKIAGDVTNTGGILTEGSLTAKNIKTSDKLIVKQDISSDNLENSGKIVTEEKLTVSGHLINNEGNIKALDSITVKEDVTNTGEILTNSTFTAKDVNTTEKLVAIGEIKTKNLINKGELSTNETLNVDGALTNTGNIKSVKNIDVTQNVTNDGDILTNGNFTAKDVVTTKKLVAHGNISTSELENTGNIETGQVLNVERNLRNTGDIQALDNIKVRDNVVNNGALITNGNLSAQDISTTKKLIAKEGLSANNLENKEKGVVGTKILDIKGLLNNEGSIEALDDISVLSNVNNTGNILTNGSFTSKDVVTSKKLIAKNGIDISSLDNSGIVGTDKELNVKVKLENSGEIKALENVLVAEDTTNTGDIETNGTFTSKNVNTSKKLIALKDISINSLKSDGILLTNQKLTVKGNLENKGKIEAVDNINISKDAENKGEILTNGTFTSKNLTENKKLLAKGNITVNNLENKGLVATGKKLIVDGELINTKEIQATEDIKVTGNTTNTGNILTGASFTSKDLKTTKKLIAKNKISTDNLDNSGIVATNDKLDINGTLKNTGSIEASKDIKVSKNVVNDGEILTGGAFSSKDVKTSKKLVAKDSISVDNLENINDKAIVATNKKLNVNGKLDNKGTIKALEDITVTKNVENTGNISTNGKFKAQDTKTTKELLAKDEIIVNNLENSGLIATDNKLTANGNLINTKNIQALGNILVTENTTNTGDILSNGAFTSKDVITSDKLIAIEGINTNNLKSKGIVATNKNLNVAGSLNNSGEVKALKNISVAENAINTGNILTSGTFTSKDTVNTKKIIAKEGISVNNLENNSEGLVATDKKLTINGKLTNNKDIQAVGNIKVSQNTVNKGTILTEGIFTSKDVNTSNKLIAKGNIVTGKLVNTGEIATENTLKVSGDLENDLNSSVQANDIDITGIKLDNKGEIKGTNLVAKVTDVNNSKDILMSENISLNSKNLSNTGNLLAGKNISANNTAFTNTGKIASNQGVFLNNSSIENSGEILSGTIEIKDLSKFENTNKISGNNVILTTGNDINLVGTLHGENNLTIEGKNIENDGSTTGKGLISISSNDFENKKELSAETLKVDAKGDLINDNSLSGKNVELKSNNLVNNDLIGAEENLSITTNDKVENTEAKTIYAGKELAIKAKEMVNTKGELLGGNISLKADKVQNIAGTIQAENDININSKNFENIGEVTDLDKYKVLYYETWDGQILTEEEVKNDWKKLIYDIEKTNESEYELGILFRKREDKYAEVVSKILDFKYRSLLFPKYAENIKYHLFDLRELEYFIEKPVLFQKIKSFGKTKYSKLIAGNKIVIDSLNTSNKDSVISGSENVKIKSDTLSNSISVGEKIKIKTGKEKFGFGLILGNGKMKSYVNYSKDFDPDFKIIKELSVDENGNEIYIDKKVSNIKYAYVTGKPSVIEGKNVIIDSNSLITEVIPEANGKIKKTVKNGKNFNSIDVKKGISKSNDKIKVENISSVEKVENNTNIEKEGKLNKLVDNKISKNEISIKEQEKIDSKNPNITKGTEVSGNNEVIKNEVKLNKVLSIEEQDKINLKNQKIDVYANLSSIEEVIKSGEVKLDNNLSSSLFIKSVSPTSKYIMETRIKNIKDSSCFGSDYFLNKVNHIANVKKWDRVRRLGDAFYENQLINRNITEKLGIAFINQRTGKELVKYLIDSAKEEAERQNLKIGKKLSSEQISNIKKDIIWYVIEKVDGIDVLVPKVYLSKNTLKDIKLDGRSRIGGFESTVIKTDNFENNGGLIGSGGTTIVEANNINNETVTNQLSEIRGTDVYLNSKTDISNIGGRIAGTDLVKLLAQEDIINKSTIEEIGHQESNLVRTRFTKIASVGEMVSEGNIIVKGDNYLSKAGEIKGKDIKIVAKNDINIEAIKLNEEKKIYQNGISYNEYVASNLIGENINIESGKDVTIHGSNIKARSNREINATKESISNLGVETNSTSEINIKSNNFINKSELTQKASIMGENININAKESISNIGSTINASNDLKLISGKDIKNLSTEKEEINKYFQRVSLNSLATINGKNVEISAKENITNKASEINAKENLNMNANNIDIYGIETSENSKSGGGSNYTIIKSKKNEKSKITAQDLKITTHKDLKIKASDIVAKQNLDIVSGGNIDIASATDSHYFEQRRKKKKSFGRTKRYLDIKYTTKNVASNLIGENINIESGNDVTILGSNIKTGVNGEANIKAKGDITQAGVKDLDYSYHKKSKSSFFGLIKESKSVESHKEEAIKSVTLGGTEGIKYDSKHDLLLEGVNVVSTGNVKIKGDNVIINPIETESWQETKKKKKGFASSFGGGSFSVSYGTDKKQNKNTVVAQNSSEITSAKDLKIEATNDITGKSVDLYGKDSVTLNANEDINLTSANNSMENKTKTSSSRLGVTVGIKGELKKTYDNITKAKELIDSNGGAYGVLNTASNLVGAIKDGASAVNTVMPDNYNSDANSAKSSNHSAVSKDVKDYITASVGFNKSKTSSKSYQEEAVKNKIGSEGNIEINSNNASVVLEGVDIKAGKNIAISAKENVDIKAAAEENKNSSSASQRGISLDMTATVNISASGQKGKGNGTTYTNSKIEAGEDYSVKAENINHIGANVEADTINITGKNVVISSVQDTSKSKDSTYGANVGIGMSGLKSLAVNGSKGKGNGSWVNEQTSLVAKNGGAISADKVENTGAIISSKNEDEKLKVVADEIVVKDLEDRFKYENKGGGISATFKETGEMNAPNTSLVHDKVDRKQVTKATAVNTEFVIAGEEKEAEELGFNTDETKAQVITKDEEKHLNADLHTDLLDKDKRDEITKAGKKLKVVGETLVSDKSGNKLDNLKEGLFGVIVDDYRKKHEQEFKLIKDKDISQEEKSVLAKALVTDFLRTHGYEGKLPEVMLTDSEHSFTQDGLNKETGEKRTEKIFFSINDLDNPEIGFAKLMTHEMIHLNTYPEGKEGEESSIYARGKVGESKKEFTPKEKEEYIKEITKKYPLEKPVEEQFAGAKKVPESEREHYEAVTIPVEVVSNVGGGKGEVGIIYNKDENGKEEFGIIYGGQILYGVSLIPGIDVDVNLYSKEGAEIKDFQGFYGGVKADVGYGLKYNFAMDIMDNKGKISNDFSLGTPNISALGNFGYRKVMSLDSLTETRKQMIREIIMKKKKIKNTAGMIKFINEVREIDKMNSRGDNSAKNRN